MKYIKKSSKTVNQVIQSIQENASNNKFGVLHIHNVSQTLKSKGLEFDEECQILDICNPMIAKKFLEANMEMSCVMPCKISVYTKDGQTFVLMNSLPTLVEAIEKDLVQVAKDAEDVLKKIVEESI